MEVLRNSPQVYPKSFQLSLPPVTDASVISSDYIQIYPSLPLTDPNNPISFSYTPSSQHYLDLASAFLHVECKIVGGKADESAVLTSSDNVSVLEDIQAAIFSNADVLIQGFPLYRSSPLYPFVTHFNNLITKRLMFPGSDVARNIISISMFIYKLDIKFSS